MDHNKLFVSEGAIEKMGMSYFKDVEYDDFKSIAAWGETVQLNDGLFLDRDDMDNYSIHTNDENDDSFEDIDTLKERIHYLVK